MLTRPKPGWQKIEAGLHWDRHRICFMEVVAPGTGSRKRRRANAPATSLAEARAAFAKFRAKKILVGTFEAYIAAAWPISKNPMEPICETTRKSEESALNLRWKSNPRPGGILDEFGRLPLTSFTSVAVGEYGAKLLKLGLNPYSVNARLRVLHKCLVHASKKLDVQIPALRDWPAKASEETLKNELSTDEAARLLEAFRSAEIHHNRGDKVSAYLTSYFRDSARAFKLALGTGLSKCDLLRLEWSHVKEEESVIEIRRLKTGVLAVIPITPMVAEALSDCRKANPFATRVLQGFSKIRLTRHWRIAKDLAKIARRVRWHDIRHSTASFMVSGGATLEEVGAVLGHARGAMTTQRYARISQSAARTAARRTGEAFQRAFE